MAETKRKLLEILARKDAVAAFNASPSEETQGDVLSLRRKKKAKAEAEEKARSAKARVPEAKRLQALRTARVRSRYNIPILATSSDKENDVSWDEAYRKLSSQEKFVKGHRTTPRMRKQLDEMARSAKARVPEAKKLESLRAARAASEKAPAEVKSSAPVPKQKPNKPKATSATKVVKKSATGKGVVTKTQTGNWVGAAPAKKSKNARDRRMAERFGISSSGKSL